MRRYLPAINATLSTLAAVYFLVLCITTFSHFSFYPLKLGFTNVLFRATHGVLLITLSQDYMPVNSPVDYHYSFLGLGYMRQIAPAYTVHFPIPLLILLLIIYPIVFLRRTRFFLSARNERLSQNLCPSCAYDLRMHRPGQKCPECGTPVPPKA